MTQNPDLERIIFEQALDIPMGEPRAAFIAAACAGNAVLQARIEALLRAESLEQGFLPPAPGTRQTVLARPTEKPGDKIGRYKLREKIGEGGCGVVYVAEQEEPVRRRVALKVIKLGMDTRSVIARFEAERQALALMDHPNIAKVLDAGSTETGRPFFVMELVRGIKITEYCDQNNLTTRQRLDLFASVCQAVQHAHQKGIIHRDLKPSNILVTLHDGVAVPKVIDFGIAKATEGRLTDLTIYTELHQFIGTPSYMSPEQAEMSGLDIDTRSDIYSLGVLLYELLTGKTPFDAEELLELGLDEMRRAIREQEPARPSTRLSTMVEGELTSTARHRSADAPRLIHLLRGDLDWIVMKALEKDRTRRYETANSFAADIARFLKNEPVLARPPSAAYKLQKLVRRNKVVFAAATAIAFALIGGAAVSAWQAARAIKARNVARANEARAKEAETVALTEKNRADAQTAQARTSAAESRERLVRLAVANGARLQAEGKYPDALLWFAHALTLDQGAAERERFHRMRCASALQHSPNLLQIFEHPSRVEYAEFNNDGTRIIATDTGGTARIWDITSGQPVTPPLRHNGNRVVHGSFSNDGRKALTASFDHTARIWDAQSGRELAVLQHEKWLGNAEFSADDALVLTSGTEDTAKVWDAATARLKWSSQERGAPARLARFSPDGQRVATAGTDGKARVWNAQTGEPLGTPMTHEGPIMSIGFSSDGRFLATGGGVVDWTARVWDAPSGTPVSPVLNQSGYVWSLAFSPDGHQLITAAPDAITVWRTSDWSSNRITLSLRHEVSMFCLYSFFSPDGKLFVAPFLENSARVYDANTLEPVTPALPHGRTVNHAAFSPDSMRLLTASDEMVRVWDLPPRQTRLASDVGSLINRSATSPDGRWTLFSSDEGTAQIVETGSGKSIAPPLKHLRDILYARFSPNGQIVVTVAKDEKDKSVRLWDAGTGRPRSEPLRVRELEQCNVFGKISDVTFTSDSSQFAAAYVDGGSSDLRIWKTQTAALLTRFPRMHGSVVHLAFSPDSHWIATACDDGVARVWNSETGEPRAAPMSHGQPVFHVSFSADNQLLVTSCGDGTARVWDAATGEPLIVPLKHEHPVRYAEFSANGTHVLTATEGGAWAWELPLDNRPSSEIVLEANVLTGRRIDPSGTFAPLTSEEIRTGWGQIKTNRAKLRPPLPAPLTAVDEVGAPFIAKLPFKRRTAGSSQLFTIGLSSFQNAIFTNMLLDFPTGTRQLRDVEFALSGPSVVKVATEGTQEHGQKDLRGNDFPTAVTGITVGRKCRALHFLHFADGRGTSEFYGSYLVHFENGRTWEIPVLNDDITNPVPFEPLPAKRSLSAWQARDEKLPKQIFQTSWENPLPDSVVTSIDFRSAGQAVFMPSILLALTVE